jgi:hypothetical protein
LRVLVDNLPDDSRTRLSQVPVAERGWEVLHELLAAGIDVTKREGWRMRRALGVTNEQPPEPLPRPRDMAVEAVDRVALDRVLAHHGIPPRGFSRDT